MSANVAPVTFLWNATLREIGQDRAGRWVADAHWLHGAGSSAMYEVGGEIERFWAVKAAALSGCSHARERHTGKGGRDQSARSPCGVCVRSLTLLQSTRDVLVQNAGDQSLIRNTFFERLDLYFVQIA